MYEEVSSLQRIASNICSALTPKSWLGTLSLLSEVRVSFGDGRDDLSILSEGRALEGFGFTSDEILRSPLQIA